MVAAAEVDAVALDEAAVLDVAGVVVLGVSDAVVVGDDVADVDEVAVALVVDAPASAAGVGGVSTVSIM